MMAFFDDERENRPIDPSNSFDEHSSDGSPDEAMDPNRLAALIEGRLSEHDREELVASIGPAEAAGVLSDAMVALAEVEGAPAARRARARRWHPGVWMALAACVAGVLLFPLAWLRSHRATQVGPEQYAALLVAHGVRMPADWNDTPWDVTRGPEELTPEARAFRIGVRVTDLGVAAREENRAAVSHYATELATLIDGVPGGGPIAAVYRDVAVHGRSADTDRADSTALTIARLTQGNSLRLGAWLEAVRLAATAHNPQALLAERAAYHGPSHKRIDSLFAQLSGQRSTHPIAWLNVMAAMDSVANSLDR